MFRHHSVSEVIPESILPTGMYIFRFLLSVIVVVAKVQSNHDTTVNMDRTEYPLGLFDKLMKDFDRVYKVESHKRISSNISRTTMGNSPAEMVKKNELYYTTSGSTDLPDLTYEEKQIFFARSKYYSYYVIKILKVKQNIPCCGLYI